MMLAVVDTRADDPSEFILDIIHRYKVPTKFLTMQHLQETRKLSDFPDQRHLRRIMIPAYIRATAHRRPQADRIAATVLDMNMVYDRLILPQRNPESRSEWCIVLMEVKFVLPTVSKPVAANVDLGILQLLAEGATIREIAEASYRSERTIHHRIERLKTRFGAENLAHLVAISISAGTVDELPSEG
ncbi:LuxR C-terminal-related transcriptional regulator [Rhizobium sp. BR 315]|uniref:LuxR C-terminal-related transcriptional regulator n=1 Tax=Rhizobium sp. BR 315 TaxID=3040014 RepID=UPI003D3443C1